MFNKKLSKIERSYCFLLAVAIDLLGLNIVYVPDKPPTKEEVDKKIEDFREMISRGEVDWE